MTTSPERLARDSATGLRSRRVLGSLLAVVVGLGGVAAAAPAFAATGSASDSFSRTMASEWGATDTPGMSWTVNTPARFAVSGGMGSVSLTNDGMTEYANLSGSGTNNQVGLLLSPAAAPGGSGLYESVVARRVAGVGQYEALVRWLPSGGVDLLLAREDVHWVQTNLTSEISVSGVRGGAGSRVRVLVETVGSSPTTLRAKVWQDGAAPPAAWTQTVTDNTKGWQAAGNIGLYNYLSSKSAPLTVRVDDVQAVYDPAAAPTSTTPAPSSAPQRTPAPQPKPSPQPTPQPSPTPGPASPPPTTPAPPTSGPAPTGGPTTPGAGAARATSTAGAAPVGSTHYPVPANAYFVSLAGSDSNPGTITAPFATATKAIKAAPSGATIVLRQGAYHESLTVPAGKTLTIENYPGETVWFDGSSQVTNWTASDNAWTADGWTAQFDASPTYTKGAADNTAPGWGFVNAAYPMAAHPDMVSIDGVPQTQVASAAGVKPGTFYVDYAAHRLYLGSNPTGHQVRASDLGIALTINGANSKILGVGFHWYADSVPTMGAVRVLAPGVLMENTVVSNNATEGIYLGGEDNLGTNDTLRHVTTGGNGLLGIAASYADGLTLDAVRSTGNNSEHFNASPVSGGIKVGRIRGVTVQNSVVSDNLGVGLWFDESTYDATVVGNDIQRNTGNGIAYEISAKGLLADNLITGNGGIGMKVNNASAMTIVNNTIAANTGRPVWIVQDDRVAANLATPGHDPRQKLPDPTVTWLLGPVTFSNNIVGASRGANCLLCVEDAALHRTANQIGVTADGNVYARPATGTPTWTTVWANGGDNPEVYASLPAFTKATGQDAHSIEITGAAPWDATYHPTAAVTAATPATAQPTSGAVAAATGHTDKHLGAWLN